jgi:hypothetical protein
MHNISNMNYKVTGRITEFLGINNHKTIFFMRMYVGGFIWYFLSVIEKEKKRSPPPKTLKLFLLLILYQNIMT